jgi:tyrosine-protein kinase Etk/Wzc
MTEPTAGLSSASGAKHEISLIALASVLVSRRRLIIALAFAGGVIALTSSLMTKRVYASRAIFLPQAAEQPNSGLAAAASQFGLTLPGSSGGWGPPMYIELLQSRMLLEPLALDTAVVLEQGGKRTPMMDLLEIKEPNPARRLELAVKQLQRMVLSTEVKSLGAVQLAVTTQWPSVSLFLAQNLVRGVNQFNLETRQSQAASERKFVEARTTEAESALRDAEDRLLDFLQRNHAFTGAPELVVQRDRLQRDVSVRQQIYTTLLQNREEARIREVRDTPVITVLEEPRLPLTPEPRGSLYKGILGGLLGAMVGVILALSAYVTALTRRRPSPEMNEFFRLLEQAKPRFLRRVS